MSGHTIVSVGLNAIVPFSGFGYSAVVGLFSTASLADKVNKTEKALKAFDANGDRVLSTRELETALSQCRHQRTPDEVMMRALLTYMVGVWRAWDRDPTGTREKLASRLSWFTRVCCESGEMGKQDYALAVFYGHGKFDDLTKVLKDAGSEVSTMIIEEKVLPMVEEILASAVGEAAAGALISGLSIFL